VIALNEYTRGAFEALSWVLSILERKNDATCRKVERMLDKIKNGVGRDFEWRLEATI